MKIYKISCYSDHGTYFNAYLQSITVIADSPDQGKNSPRSGRVITNHLFIQKMNGKLGKF